MSSCHAATVTKRDSMTDFDVCPYYSYSAVTGAPSTPTPTARYTSRAARHFTISSLRFPLHPLPLRARSISFESSLHFRSTTIPPSITVLLTIASQSGGALLSMPQVASVSPPHLHAVAQQVHRCLPFFPTSSFTLESPKPWRMAIRWRLD